MFTTKKVAQLTGYEPKNLADDKATGHCQFMPKAQGWACLWRLDELVAMTFYVSQRQAGLTVKLAGQSATRLLHGMRDHPDADQLTVVEIENGAKSILPTNKVDLGTGVISGGYLATAFIVDVRNMKIRVQRAIDADAAIIGDRDA